MKCLDKILASRALPVTPWLVIPIVAQKKCEKYRYYRNGLAAGISSKLRSRNAFSFLCTFPYSVSAG